LFSGDPRAAALRRDAVALVASDATLARVAAAGGEVDIVLRPPGFATMIWLILGQQVSIEAADALFAVLEGVLGTVTPAGLLRLDDETLRRCGFSRQKAGYARSLAREVLGGEFDLDGVGALPDAEAVAALAGRRGVGVWTAENYLIWALGRRDVFPAGDLALRLGWQAITAADAAPSEAALRAVAAAWAPCRTAAAFLVWGHYLEARGRGGSRAGSTLQGRRSTRPR
jgi:DNA-3-methyladenine glycosylase II